MIKIESAFPLYVANDIEAQKTFYSETFGFEAVFYDPEFYVHLVNPANGIEIGFMLTNLKAQPAFLHQAAQANGMVITFEVADAASAYAQAKKDDLNIVFKLKEEPWKQTHFMVKDPAGLIVDIVEDTNQSE